MVQICFINSEASAPHRELQYTALERMRMGSRVVLNDIRYQPLYDMLNDSLRYSCYTAQQHLDCAVLCQYPHYVQAIWQHYQDSVDIIRRSDNALLRCVLDISEILPCQMEEWFGYRLQISEPTYDMVSGGKLYLYENHYFLRTSDYPAVLWIGQTIDGNFNPRPVIREGWNAIHNDRGDIIRQWNQQGRIVSNGHSALYHPAMDSRTFVANNIHYYVFGSVIPRLTIIQYEDNQYRVELDDGRYRVWWQGQQIIEEVWQDHYPHIHHYQDGRTVLQLVPMTDGYHLTTTNGDRRSFQRWDLELKQIEYEQRWQADRLIYSSNKDNTLLLDLEQGIIRNSRLELQNGIWTKLICSNAIECFHNRATLTTQHGLKCELTPGSFAIERPEYRVCFGTYQIELTTPRLTIHILQGKLDKLKWANQTIHLHNNGQIRYMRIDRTGGCTVREFRPDGTLRHSISKDGEDYNFQAYNKEGRLIDELVKRGQRVRRTEYKADGTATTSPVLQYLPHKYSSIIHSIE